MAHHHNHILPQTIKNPLEAPTNGKSRQSDSSPSSSEKNIKNLSGHYSVEVHCLGFLEKILIRCSYLVMYFITSRLCNSWIPLVLHPPPKLPSTTSSPWLIDDENLCNSFFRSLGWTLSLLGISNSWNFSHIVTSSNYINRTTHHKMNLRRSISFLIQERVVFEILFKPCSLSFIRWQWILCNYWIISIGHIAELSWRLYAKSTSPLGYHL